MGGVRSIREQPNVAAQHTSGLRSLTISTACSICPDCIAVRMRIRSPMDSRSPVGLSPHSPAKFSAASLYPSMMR